MELLLTPVVNKILSRFIKKLDDGTPGSQLRARLYGGSFVLHNLELNLDRYLSSIQVLPSIPIQTYHSLRFYPLTPRFACSSLIFWIVCVVSPLASISLNYTSYSTHPGMFSRILMTPTSSEKFPGKQLITL